MDRKDDNELRVAALCKRLGHLWSEEDVVEVNPEISLQKRDECKRTILGKLYSRPNVNVPAFFTTLKKAWKVEAVECAQKGTGLFTFVFQSEVEKDRILKSAPWCYSNNLLVLKQCEPEITEHCYDFSRAAFWVRIGGIPPGWRVETVYHDLGKKLGQVQEIQLETMGNLQQKGGRVRVEVDLTTPLKA
ncbi:hypothetical protein EUGRSUZ_L01803 [Eucalyptus grandis]|uniref:DUF4283 domain-containing protein n=1 Tax=Eucalyptus grandis TaxID=71139 RepID=A0A058ZS96_EUCGR|nr:hypothetical protein EUGRSUZ_L01803 [Eucalyptus grandis]